MKILVVEDDPLIAYVIETLLVSHHYTVDLAADGSEGLEMAEAYDYNLILLDIGLPNLDGVSLCQQLRSKGIQTPILLLTGQEAEAQAKATALNAGADDYVTKPFDAEELLARIQSLLRRGDLKAQPILKWGHLSLEPSQLQVSYGKTLLNLTPKEYSLLEVLLRHAPKIQSVHAILEQGWNALEIPGDETVRNHVKELRKKLKAAGAPEDFIKTVHRQGYRLNPLYGEAQFCSTDKLSSLQIAQLKRVNEELRQTLEQLQATQAELRKKNQDLEIAQEALAQEQQQLQAARNQLAMQVTERTQQLIEANQGLQQQQNQWQALFDHAQEAILIADDEGHYVDANPAACELLGMTRQDLLRCNVADIADPAMDIAAVWQQFLHDGELSGEFQIHRPDGQIKDTEFNAIAHFIPGRHLSILRDISDRKRAEAALQKSETQLSRIFDNVGAAIGEFSAYRDRSYVHGFMSVGCEGVYGYSQAEMMGDRHLWQSRVVLEDLEGVIIPAYEQIFAEASFTVEYRFQDKTDTIRWISETLHSHWDEAAACWQVTTVATNISDRKQLELNLQTSKAKLSQVLNRAIAAICSFRVYANQDWEYEYWSAGCERLFGYSVEELTEKPLWMSRVDPEDLETIILPLFKDFCAEREVRVEYRFRHKNGQIRWIAGTYASEKIAEDCWIVTAVLYDISEQKRLDAERKQAEQTLRDSEQRLQAILDHSPAIIYLLDLQNRHLLVNHSYAEQLATTPAALVGKSLHEVWPAEVADRFATQNRSVLKTGQILQMEDTAPLADGIHSYLTVKFPLGNATGPPYAIGVIATDITEKKNLEAQFYQAQRLESLGILASDIAHDLNNMLTPILTMAQILQLTQKGLDAKGLERLKFIESSAKRGGNLVKQILSMTRVPEGQREPVDWAALLQEETTIIQQSFPTSIEIQIDVPPSQKTQPALGMILINPTYLHQIVLNLCVNARDAMPNGGTLTISAAKVFVDEAMAAQNLDAHVGDYALLTVADTGIGIPPEVKERMFDPFFTTKEQGQGTGLGLATVRGLVKANEGFLRVYTQVGQGTQFKVYFPLIASNSPEQDPSEPQLIGTPSHQGAWVLVVEDEEMVRRMLQALLEIYHYRVLLAQNGAEALEQYRLHQSKIQLVVTDLTMPNQDGFNLISNLKAIHPELPILAISGVLTHEETALATGADYFLAKPFNLETLLGQISALLNPVDA